MIKIAGLDGEASLCGRIGEELDEDWVNLAKIDDDEIWQPESVGLNSSLGNADAILNPVSQLLYLVE